jgi:hypothetical protein
MEEEIAVCFDFVSVCGCNAQNYNNPAADDCIGGR